VLYISYNIFEYIYVEFDFEDSISLH